MFFIFINKQKIFWNCKDKEAPFSSLQVLTFCLLIYSARGFLKYSMSLGGMHREVPQQQWEETDCSASLQGLLEGAICSLIPSCSFSPASTFCCLLPTCCLNADQITVSCSWKTLSFSFMEFLFFFFHQNCRDSSEVLTWHSWICSYFQGASLSC